MKQKNPVYEDTDLSNDHELVPVDPKRFQKLNVKKESQLDELIEDEYHLPYVRGCAFYEFSHDTEDVSKEKEVIVMSKVLLPDLL